MCAFFSVKKMFNECIINLKESEIPVVDQYMVLEIIFNNKLTLIPKIYLKTECTRAQYLLQIVAHSECGADR